MAGVVGFQKKKEKSGDCGGKKRNPPGRIKTRFNSGETMIRRAGWGFLTSDTSGGKIKGLAQGVKKRYPHACAKEKRKEGKNKGKRPKMTNLGNLSPNLALMKDAALKPRKTPLTEIGQTATTRHQVMSH